ncbi:hypothetical protein KDA_71790 [Dictyobacter alpinus]|uniref:histidine kinase n=1 Tax=Dictyobacter alpinus TaxID=2014873 RepID=A0A402BK31_9CHLR|nr:ATP-binding protein [Dictyobacter alpinus]GCE31695.1 hypothetical protein KDA_71790 [Dictyobacter alpinus]
MVDKQTRKVPHKSINNKAHSHSNRHNQPEHRMSNKHKIAIASPVRISEQHSDTFKAIVTNVVEGIVVTNMDEKVQWSNAAALALLELRPADFSSGDSLEQLFSRCRMYDPYYRPLAPARCFAYFHTMTDAESRKQTVLCLLPSGRIACFDIGCTLIKKPKQPAIKVYLFHDLTNFYQQQNEDNRSKTAMLSLINAISHLHDLLAASPPEETLSIPSSVHIIGQHLADLIRDLLEGQAVFLFSLGSQDKRLYYIAFSGLTPEQTELRWQNSGRFGLADFLDSASIEQLYAHKQVSVDREHIRIPFLPKVDFPAENLFWTPLFVKGEIVGMFVLGRDRPCNPEESELVQAVSTLTTFMLEYVRPFATMDQQEGKELVMQATGQIINTFLNLASHELKTPLTATMGNIQLALRRLEKLKAYADASSSAIRRKVEQVKDPLEAASDSTRVQARIIGNLIDDAQIQTNTLELHPQQYELTELIQETIAQHQQQHPNQQINFILPQQELWVNIDRERINQVLEIYLTNAQRQSPAEQPITIQIRPELSHAYIDIRDQGPGIPLEEQAQLWERLYRSQGTAPQNDLDLSMGMNFYLCRTLIELHHGLVGVESMPGQGAIFWFSLPLSQQGSAKQ